MTVDPDFYSPDELHDRQGGSTPERPLVVHDDSIKQRNAKVIQAYCNGTTGFSALARMFHLSSRGTAAGIIQRAQKAGRLSPSGTIPGAWVVTTKALAGNPKPPIARPAAPRLAKIPARIVKDKPAIVQESIKPDVFRAATGSSTLEIVQETSGCRWPVSHDRPHLFCGAARHSPLPFVADGQPYCSDHRKQGYQKPSGGLRAAERAHAERSWR